MRTNQESSADQLRRALSWIHNSGESSAERVAEAAARYQLSSAEEEWLMFLLHPASRALDPGWEFNAHQAERSHERLHMFCPRNGRRVDCTVEKADTGITDVSSCSEFSPPERISCGKECLALLRRGVTLDSDSNG